MIESCESKDDFLKDILKEIIWIIKMCFFWGGELTLPPGVTLDKAFCVPFLPTHKKKVGGRRKFDIWLTQIIGEFCASLSFWLSDACLTKLLWVECLLLTHLLSFSGQVHWMLCLWSWENQPIVMTSIQGKRQRGDVTWWERERKRGQGSWDDQIRLFLLWHCI